MVRPFSFPAFAADASSVIAFAALRRILVQLFFLFLRNLRYYLDKRTEKV